MKDAVYLLPENMHLSVKGIFMPASCLLAFAGQVLNKLLFLGGFKIFPLSHPASLLYNPSYEPDTTEKYKKLQILLHDCKWFPTCPIKRFFETGMLDKKWIELYCRGDWKKCVRYEMEELGHYHPDWMLPDGSLDGKLKDYEL